MNNTLTAVSLFTGAGGMDIGFERAGVKIIFANEMMSEAAQTYNATLFMTYKAHLTFTFITIVTKCLIIID